MAGKEMITPVLVETGGSGANAYVLIKKTRDYYDDIKREYDEAMREYDQLFQFTKMSPILQPINSVVTQPESKKREAEEMNEPNRLRR